MERNFVKKYYKIKIIIIIIIIALHTSINSKHVIWSASFILFKYLKPPILSSPLFFILHTHTYVRPPNLSQLDLFLLVLVLGQYAFSAVGCLRWYTHCIFAVILIYLPIYLWFRNVHSVIKFLLYVCLAVGIPLY